MQALLDVLADRHDAPPQLDAAGWEAFLAEASRHGVSALAHHRLQGRPVPPQVLQALERHHVKNKLRNLRLVARVAALLGALRAQAISVVVLKGLHLAQTVYADTALRAMADADLLVRASDLDRAAQTMRALGWGQGAALMAEGGHQLPTFELDGVQVELHWTIEDDAAPFAVDIAGLWERAQPVCIGQSQALGLSPEDLLLHLCMHTAYGHGWRQFDGGLRQLGDIAVVVRHHVSTLDWHTFATRAVAWRVRRCVWLALITARDLLGVAVPEAVFDHLAPPQPHAPWIALARELVLGNHYADLARCLPVLGQSSMHKRWRLLSPVARWRVRLFPGRRSLRRVYPGLEGRPALAQVAHWKDLAIDLLRLAFDAGHRRVQARERERHRVGTKHL